METLIALLRKIIQNLKISQKDDCESFQCHTETLTGLTHVNSSSKAEGLNWNTTEIGGWMILSR